MSIPRVLLTAATLSMLAGIGSAAPATYVSVYGSDTASCARSAPCRTFAGALPHTDPDGVIVALDSGVFGTGHLDIRQPVTLAAAPGVHAELLSKDFAAISVNAGADDVIILRGLTLAAVDGAATPLNGIVYNRAASLVVERCVIQGFPTKGILVLSQGRLLLQGSVVRGSFVGVSLDNRSHATFDDVRLEDNEWGLNTSLGARATIQDSVVTGNSEAGMLVSGDGSRVSELTVVRCAISHNATGVETRAFEKAPGIVRLSDNTITDNEVGVLVSGHAIAESRSNNTIRGNGTDIAGALSPFAGE